MNHNELLAEVFDGKRLLSETVQIAQQILITATLQALQVHRPSHPQAVAVGNLEWVFKETKREIEFLINEEQEAGNL